MAAIIAWIAVLTMGCGSNERAAETTSSNVQEFSTPLSPILESSSARAAYVLARQAEGASDPAYHVRASEHDGLSASNTPHGFSATFRAEGVRLSSSEGGFEIGLSTSAVRCGSTRKTVTGSAFRAAASAARPHRVERSIAAGESSVHEWFENGPLGLEQGWTLPKSPCADGTTELGIEVSVDGRRAVASSDGSSVALAGPGLGAPSLFYADLFAKDANGTTLPTRLEADGERIVARVDVSGAVWPVLVDPLVATQQGKLLASGTAPYGSAGDNFGFSVSIDPLSGFSQVAAIGAPFDDVSGAADRGSVYVFQDIAGWDLLAWVVASDGAAGDRFGHDVAISGGTLVVGAPVGNGIVADSGAAYVFLKSGNVFTQQQKLTAADGAALDYYGTSVAVDGNTALVGSPLDDVGANANQGSTYVYLRSGTTWAQQAKLVAGTSPDANDQFGTSVALLGNDAVIGAPGNYYTVSGAGAAYVFNRVTTTWSQQGYLVDSTPSPSAAFGTSVAIGSNVVAIGEPYESGGRVQVFNRTTNVWSFKQFLSSAYTTETYSLGRSVAFNNATIIAGSAESPNSNASQGAAHVYTYNTTTQTWSAQARLLAKDGAAGDELGFDVSVVGNTALIGAKTDDVGANADQGSAYVFDRVVTSWTESQKLIASETAIGDSTGRSVAVDGDYALVGVPGDDMPGMTSPGSVYAFLRSGSVWNMQTRITAPDAAGSAAFGTSVALEGTTALIGAPGDLGSEGSAYVFVRSGVSWSQQQKLVDALGQESSWYGTSVALSGETALVGVPGGGASYGGAAWVYVRSGTVWSPQQKLLPTGTTASDRIGSAVALAGDTAIIASPEADVSGKVDQGAAYVFVRSGTTWSEQQKLVVASGVAGDAFGASVAILGNRAAVGAPGYDLGSPNRGAAYVFNRSGSTWTAETPLVAGAGAPDDGLGSAVALGTDLILIGASSDDVATSANAGSVVPFTRDVLGAWTEQPTIVHNDYAGNDAFGSAIDLSGTTLLVGAPGKAFESSAGVGAAYPFLLTGLAGQGCGSTAACATGYTCVDGVCCKSTCSGVCEVCSAAKGATANGECTPLAAGSSPQTSKGTCGVLCNGSSGSCPAGCTDDTLCAANQFCDSSGACVTRKGNGFACNIAPGGECKVAGCRACASNFCVDGMCCNTACSGGACDTCKVQYGATVDGTCTTLAKGATPEPPGCTWYLCGGAASCPSSCTATTDCAPGSYCAAGTPSTCVPKKANGLDCTTNEQCGSGHCADGVCCNTECLGKCEACKAANKESGASSGICDAAKQGTNPGNQCQSSATDPCGAQPACSGVKGVCAVAAFGTSCGPTSCNGTAVSGKVCDGTGTCIDQQNAQCSPYVCQAGSCTSPCTQDAHCVTGNYCQGGFCVPKLTNGKACSTANQCDSSFCVDGVCCDSPCTGQCEACAETGSVGQCKVVTGKPRGTRTDCTGTLACKGQCDGTTPTQCSLPGGSTQCQPPNCAGDVAQPPGGCDNAGGCSVPPTKNCAPYACDATAGACKTTCASNADCSQGSVCDTSTNKCAVATASCQDGFTVKLPNGQTQSCVPYKCVGGACQQQCTSAGDCAPGYDCSGSSCVAVTDAGTGGAAGSSGTGGTAGIGGAAGAGGSQTGGTSAGGTGGTSTGGTSAGGAGTGGKSDAGVDGGAGSPASGGESDEGGCGCRVVSGSSERTSHTWLLSAALLLLVRRRRR